MTHRHHRILLAGLGGDSHSVGISILRAGLEAHGFQVRFMGAQNELDQIMEIARHFNAVLLSNMDGHAKFYLKRFPELRKAPYHADTTFYLGGNIATSNREKTKRDFMEMGFARVFLRFVSVEEVVALLHRDLGQQIPKRGHYDVLSNLKRLTEVPSAGMMEEDAFLEQRQMVLQQWPTGADCADLEANAAFLAETPNFGEVHRAQSVPIAHVRVGVPNLSEQLRYLSLVKKTGVKVLSHQVDSLTRLGKYDEAEAVLTDHARSKASFLNGLPMINHGVVKLRKLTRELALPLQTRHSARDPRLLAEISYASGISGFEGGPIGYNLPYYRDYEPADALHAWRYVERLTGLYHQRFGIVLDREFFGPLTGTLVPPCIAIVSVLLECLFSAQQGVRSFSLGLGEMGHRIQDVAGLHVLRTYARKLLAKHIGEACKLNLVFHQYMAAFPRDLDRARELIFESAVTAALGKADRVIVKTPVEAYRIPRLADNLEALQIVARGFEHAKLLQIDPVLIAEEAAQIEREVTELLDAILEVGKGCVARSIVEAIRLGLIDVPFAPSIHNCGKAMTARDVEGAVRFLRVGNLPFSKETKQFHLDRMSQRRLSFGNLDPNNDFQMTQFDAIQITTHQYEQWPMDGKTYLPN